MERVMKREVIFNSADAWPTTEMSNHDLPRAASRYSRGEDDTQAFLAMTLLLTLRGTPFMYYGEEIGMRNIHLRRNEILDPPGKKYWPIYKGRDGCRSPMQWDDAAFAGFSSQKPWLPIHPDYMKRNVNSQNADPDSLFNFTKKLLALRREFPALCRGDFMPLETPPGMLAYLRRSGDQSVLVAMNFSNRETGFPPPPGQWRVLLSTSKGSAGALTAGEIQLLILE
jgi:alpha-glucosidase